MMLSKYRKKRGIGTLAHVFIARFTIAASVVHRCTIECVWHVFGLAWFANEVQGSPLYSNSRGLSKFVLIMGCFNYEFALNKKFKYNGLSRDHNHLSELTEFLN